MIKVYAQKLSQDWCAILSPLDSRQRLSMDLRETGQAADFATKSYMVTKDSKYSAVDVDEIKNIRIKDLLSTFSKLHESKFLLFCILTLNSFRCIT